MLRILPEFPSMIEPGPIALARWENEGGATVHSPAEPLICGIVPPEFPRLSSGDLPRLRVRVVALDQLAVTRLARTPEAQRDLVCSVASRLSPQGGRATAPAHGPGD